MKINTSKLQQSLFLVSKMRVESIKVVVEPTIALPVMVLSDSFRVIGRLGVPSETPEVGPHDPV